MSTLVSVEDPIHRFLVKVLMKERQCRGEEKSRRGGGELIIEKLRSNQLASLGRYTLDRSYTYLYTHMHHPVGCMSVLIVFSR